MQAHQSVDGRAIEFGLGHTAGDLMDKEIIAQVFEYGEALNGIGRMDQGRR